MKGVQGLAKPPQSGKHTVYFNMLDACKKGGCPVCTMTLDSVTRYLAAIVYEYINDPRTRDPLVTGRGYCNSHSWQLRTAGASLGAAFVYRDVLRHVADEIERRPAGGRLDLFNSGQGGVRGRLASLVGRGADGEGDRSVADPHRACPACRERTRSELSYLQTVLDHIHDDQLADALGAAGGLCLVHLDLAASLGRDEAAVARLLEVERQCLQCLTDEVSEFIRKNDYRFTHEVMGEEGDSWIRAIEAAAGKRGIR